MAVAAAVSPTRQVVAGYVPVIELARDVVVGVDTQAPRQDAGAPLAVLTEACADLRAWRERLSRRPSHAALTPGGPLTVTVDVGWPALTIPEAADRVAAAAAAAGIVPADLCLAVDTADVVCDVPAAVGALRALREVGVRLALDGFGAAEGTLRLLERLPVHELRVDVEVIRALTHDRMAQSTALALVSLAQSFELLAVAPQVATEGQLAQVRTLGFDRAQGPALPHGLGWPLDLPVL